VRHGTATTTVAHRPRGRQGVAAGRARGLELAGEDAVVFGIMALVIDR
jgi:hypothetical protein